ncbi:MAG: twin-arginine translocation signal domain-containing protein, partial [Planctomycetota bacterium]
MGRDPGRIHQSISRRHFLQASAALGAGLISPRALRGVRVAWRPDDRPCVRCERSPRGVCRSPWPGRSLPLAPGIPDPPDRDLHSGSRSRLESGTPRRETSPCPAPAPIPGCRPACRDGAASDSRDL